MTHPSSSNGWSTKTLAWSCAGSFVAGVAFLYAAGFHFVGSWQTGEEVAKRLAVASCMQEFLLQPNRGVLYAELKETTSSYQRRQLLRTQKLAQTIEIADLCGDGIRALDASLFEPPAEMATEAKQPA